jgi:magnesium transporter
VLTELPARGWIHVAAPDAADRRRLGELGVSEDFVKHALDKHELARIEHDGGSEGTLIIIRLPPRETGRRANATLGVVLFDDRLVTIAGEPVPLIDEVAGREVLREARPLRQLVELLFAIAQTFVVRVDKIDERVEKLEQAIAKSQQNREVLALLEEQKGLVHLDLALASNKIMLERLLEEPRCKAKGDEKEILDDALVEFRQAAEMTRISTEILSGMMDAFASIINNNLNQVFKVLAALTIVLAVPNLMVGMWGMNVPVPGEQATWAFAALVCGAIALALGVALLFRSKRWL